MIIERQKILRFALWGGNYVNSGCISAVALLESAKLFQSVNQGIADHGISANNIQVDIAQMQKRKKAIVALLNQQVEKNLSIIKSRLLKLMPSLLTLIK